MNARHSSVDFAVKPALLYPFGEKWAPSHGEPYEVADGIFWVRMPLPIELDHINIWLLKDNDGWIIVDAGYDDPECKAIWETIFTTFLDPKDVNRVIITHMHPDHTGLASWLAHRCDCRIYMSQGELDWYRRIFTNDRPDPRDRIISYLFEIGYEQALHERILTFFEVDDKPEEMRIQRSMCDILKDGDTLKINQRQWRVITGNGHSPEHVCLYSEELGVFISGDQAIPRISSNVSAFPENKDTNPLKDWLESCEKLPNEVPDTALVLPGHQDPFYGLHVRMQQLIYDHHAQLNRLQQALVSPRTTMSLLPVLFDRQLEGAQIFFATGEARAHLNFLLQEGVITKEENSDKVLEYVVDKPTYG